MDDIISGTYFADDTGKIMIVKLQGYIDQTNSYGLQKVFDDIIKSGCYNVIIDFSEVMYISSAGWGIFVGEIKHFRDENGDIKLANMSPDIYEVYQMLEFYHIFEDYNSIELAKKSFSELVVNSTQISNTIEETQDDSLEIELDDDIDLEEKPDNILEISMNKSNGNEIEPQLNPNIDDFEDASDDIDIEIDENLDSDVETIQGNSVDSVTVPERQPPVEERKHVIDLSRLPIHEKIKKLIAEFPLLSIWRIKKLLKDDRFGTVKINIFQLYKLLKDMDLETKYKRYRYYRSC